MFHDRRSVKNLIISVRDEVFVAVIEDGLHNVTQRQSKNMLIFDKKYFQAQLTRLD